MPYLSSDKLTFWTGNNSSKTFCFLCFLLNQTIKTPKFHTQNRWNSAIQIQNTRDLSSNSQTVRLLATLVEPSKRINNPPWDQPRSNTTTNKPHVARVQNPSKIHPKLRKRLYKPPLGSASQRLLVYLRGKLIHHKPINKGFQKLFLSPIPEKTSQDKSKSNGIKDSTKRYAPKQRC